MTPKDGEHNCFRDRLYLGHSWWRGYNPLVARP